MSHNRNRIQRRRSGSEESMSKEYAVQAAGVVFQHRPRMSWFSSHGEVGSRSLHLNMDVSYLADSP